MRWLGFGAAALALGWALGARAGNNDFSLYKLGDPTAPNTGAQAQERFRMLSDELGVSIASTNLQPASTLGMNGFDLSLEIPYVLVNSSAQVGGQVYWVTNTPNPGYVVVPALHFRKGLPFSIEAGGKVATIVQSGMFAATGEIKWAPVEGLRYAPDFSIRFAMSRLFGQPDLTLVSAVLDACLGKEFSVTSFTLAPYLGYSALGVDSSTLVLNVNPTQTTAAEVKANPLVNQGVFAGESWRNNLYHRPYLGLRLLSQVTSLILEYSISIPYSGDGLPVSTPLQTFSFKVGLTI
jgi:hypothetical protein